MHQKNACFLVIGNEILSGRTQDANIQVLACALNEQGIRLTEVRIIPDIAERIISTVGECRARFDMVFTSGGIGPTHDDITALCVAEAVGVRLIRHEESFRRLETHFASKNFNEARQRMAWLPEGATTIENSVSVAPGFSIGNVHVMAGVPKIFASMVKWLVPQLEGGTPLVSASWHSPTLYEGDLAQGLEAIQSDFPHLDIGSYPYERKNGRGVALVAKGYDPAAVQSAAERIHALISSLGANPIEGEPAPDQT